MQSIKIIGGQFKKKIIPFLPHASVRPTSHRTRETVFNILRHRLLYNRVGGTGLFLEHMHILDICAGTGSYGFESLSHGAARVTFIEHYAPMVKHLREWSYRLAPERCNVIHTSFPQIHTTQYDVIFLDPPYTTDENTCKMYIDHAVQLLRPGGVLCFETGSDTDFGHASLEVYKTFSSHVKLWFFTLSLDTVVASC